MKLVDEIKRPKYDSVPEFSMVRKENPTSHKFKCQKCDWTLEIDFQRQINYSWTGKTERIHQAELEELKTFYSIGLSSKSHDGGLPIFDKINCSECGTEYITYCGVNEYANSAFNVYVHGILRPE